MPWFSIVMVEPMPEIHAKYLRDVENYVVGSWLQDHYGDLESATELAKKYEDHPSGRKFAVLERISEAPVYRVDSPMRRLDTPRS